MTRRQAMRTAALAALAPSVPTDDPRMTATEVRRCYAEQVANTEQIWEDLKRKLIHDVYYDFASFERRLAAVEWEMLCLS